MHVGGGGGGESAFASNLSKSKSFKYSMASGLGGSVVMGREGDDIAANGFGVTGWS